MLRNLTIRVALVFALAMAAVPTARAADQTILGSQLVVTNPSTPEKRKVVAKAKEVGSPDTIVGNPAAGGANLSIAANGSTPSAQTFTLLGGTSALTGKPFWSGDAVRGFKYKDYRGENGPVKAAQLKKSGSGPFQLKAVAVGKLGAIAVLPPDFGTDGCVRLEVGGGGDTYHVRFGADGQVTNDGTKQFKVVKPTGEGTCPPPTLSPTTTTTTLPCALGQPVGNFCWFLGALAADCDATCAAQGLVYDPATATYAGSAGTSANCEAVLTALGRPGMVFDALGIGGVGCAYLPACGFDCGPVNIRAIDEPTTSGASSVVERACACM